jgi:uncharacterized protein involved in exopolysaccharide biosynthesis
MIQKFRLLEIIVFLLRRRRLLVLNLLIAAVLGGWYAFIYVKPQFRTDITFLPPVETNSLSSMLSGLSLGGGGGLGGSDIMPEQIVTIFNSQALRRSVIDTYNLLTKYKVAKKASRYKAALNRLNRDLIIETNEVGSLGITKVVSYTISAFHTSPDTSYAMVCYTYMLIDSVIREISTGNGRANRLFVESQLTQSKAMLDSLQTAFKAFQLKYKAYDMPEQVSASLKSFAQLKSMMVSNEIRIQRMQKDYAPGHPQLVTLQKANAVLQGKLDEIEKAPQPDIMVGLDLSTILVPQFTNLYRDIEVQNQIILYLSQELEQSRIKEAHDVSLINQVDPAHRPLYKARPKRMILFSGILIGYMACVVLLFLLKFAFMTRFRDSGAYQEILSVFRNQ